MAGKYAILQSYNRLINLKYEKEAHPHDPIDNYLEKAIQACLKARDKYGFDSIITSEIMLEDGNLKNTAFHENFPGSLDGLRAFAQQVLVEKVRRAVEKSGGDLPIKLKAVYKALSVGDGWHVIDSKFKVKNMNLLSFLSSTELEPRTWGVIMEPLRPAIEEYLQKNAPGWNYATSEAKEEFNDFAMHFRRIVQLLTKVDLSQCDRIEFEHHLDDCVSGFLQRIMSAVRDDLGDAFHHDTYVTRIISRTQANNKNKVSPGINDENPGDSSYV